MKFSILITLLAVSLTAAIPIPGTQSKIQIRSLGPRVDLPELVLAVESTLRDISVSAKKFNDALYVMLEGNSQQGVVKEIADEGEAGFQKIYEDTMAEALQSDPAELPELINRTLEQTYRLLDSTVESVKYETRNESREILLQRYVIVLDFISEVIYAVQPLVDLLES